MDNGKGGFQQMECQSGDTFPRATLGHPASTCIQAIICSIIPIKVLHDKDPLCE